MIKGPVETTTDYDVTFFIACYNEEEGIIPTIEEVLAAVSELQCTYDIVIIDDASTDRSVSIVQEFLDEHPDLQITLYVAKVNQGLGANYAEASFRGRGKYYRLVSGDNVEPKETLTAILKHIGEADMILPYPTETHCRGIGRRMLSGAFTSLVNLIGGYKINYYNGSAVHLRYNVMRWHSNAHGFGFQADLVTRLLDMGATYVQVPVVPRERAAGSSKALTIQNICSVAHSLMDIFIRRVAKISYHKARRRTLAELTVYGAGASAPGEQASTSAALDVPAPSAHSITELSP